MSSSKKKNTPLNSYMRYSGMAFQMGIIIAAGTFGSIKLDKWLNTKPFFTIVGSLLSIAIAMYLSLRDFFPPKNKK